MSSQAITDPKRVDVDAFMDTFTFRRRYRRWKKWTVKKDRLNGVNFNLN